MIKVERNENLYESMQKKKKKKKNLYQHNFAFKHGLLGTWNKGFRRILCTSDSMELGFTTCSGGYIIFSIISLEILSWILGVIESSGRLFFNVP